MKRLHALLLAVTGVVWGGGCPSPTVNLATEKPIEIKIELQHEVRLHLDREVSELVSSEAASGVSTRGGAPSDEELVLAAKAQGVLGEQANGYLGLPTAAGDRVLVERVNAARYEEYQDLARRSGVPLEQVEKTAGANRIRAASAGERVRTPEGEWIEKDEATVVVVKDQSGA